MCKITVVVPVYRTEATVVACVSSILAQSFPDFELLLINDGSPDNSDAVCQALAQRDKRIQYIQKENGGPSSVRNLGIDQARGEYLCFADSDDVLEPDALSYMLAKAEETAADIVLCGYFMENGKSAVKVFTEEGVYSAAEAGRRLIELKEKNLIDPPWNKLYRLDYLRKTGVRMPEGQLYEDTAFHLALLAHNPRFAVSSRCLYHYILRMGSITRRYNPEKLETLKQCALLLKKNTNGMDAYCDFCYLKFVFSSFMDMFLSCKRGEVLRAVRQELTDPAFQQAAAGADMAGRGNRLIIRAARSGNACAVYGVCRLLYFLKYKCQRLFMKGKGL